jgi:hypothetical protein
VLMMNRFESSFKYLAKSRPNRRSFSVEMAPIKIGTMVMCRLGKQGQFLGLSMSRNDKAYFSNILRMYLFSRSSPSVR